jgi:cytochrome oxidase assembly protein ShyY1
VKAAAPSHQAGHDSLVYVREIAKSTESKYVDEFTAQFEQAYLKDILSQVWRNSQLLKEKFDHISVAFNWMALAIVLWVAILVVLAIYYPARTNVKLP